MPIRFTQIHQVHGHMIDVLPTGQFYQNDASPVDWENLRPCVACGACMGKDDHDSCISGLPGTRNACCGHGVIEENTAPRSLGVFVVDGLPNEAFRRGLKPWGYVDLIDGRRLEFQGDCGGARIRAAVDAALKDLPLPDGFSFDDEDQNHHDQNRNHDHDHDHKHASEEVCKNCKG
jgi:hypothetical protein